MTNGVAVGVSVGVGVGCVAVGDGVSVGVCVIIGVRIASSVLVAAMAVSSAGGSGVGIDVDDGVGITGNTILGSIPGGTMITPGAPSEGGVTITSVSAALCDGVNVGTSVTLVGVGASVARC